MATKMWGPTTKVFEEELPKDLSQDELEVLDFLVEASDYSPDEAPTNLRAIAQSTRLPLRRVREALESLERRGLVGCSYW